MWQVVREILEEVRDTPQENGQSVCLWKSPLEVITDILHERLSEASRSWKLSGTHSQALFLSRSGIYRSQIGEETVEVVWIILLERVQQCSVEQLADVFGRTSASPHG